MADSFSLSPSAPVAHVARPPLGRASIMLTNMTLSVESPADILQVRELPAPPVSCPEPSADAAPSRCTAYRCSKTSPKNGAGVMRGSSGPGLDLPGLITPNRGSRDGQDLAPHVAGRQADPGTRSCGRRRCAAPARR